MSKDNIVNLTGRFTGEFEFSHQVFREKFYTNHLVVYRTSGNLDIIPIIASELLLDVHKKWEGNNAYVAGEFRSYNKCINEKKRLILCVCAKEINITTGNWNNFIFLDGYICKSPSYRKTPLGQEIADVLLAVNRKRGKSDYIPCIVWGRNARFIARFKVGSNIKIFGRIQSRNTGKIFDNESEERVVYEASVSKIEVCNG